MQDVLNEDITEAPIEQKEITKKGKLKAILKEISEWVVPYFVVLVIAITFFLCFRIVTVNGSSMDDTYHSGDVVMVNALFYSEADYGDVVVIKATEQNVPLIKRVIAKGGDEIDIDFDNGTVTVNGEVLSEEYIKEPTHKNEGAFEYPVTVPEGHYFVMGDNRNQSSDSRNPSIGFIPNDNIIGTVIINFGNII